MNVAIFVAHELKITDRHCDWLGANTKKTTDVDDRGVAAMYMANFANFVIVSTVDCRAFEDRRSQFPGSQSNMIGMVHLGLL